MKIKLEFEPDDIEMAMLAINGHKYAYLMDEVADHIRSRLKYEELSDEVRDALEKVRQVIIDSDL